MSNSSASANTLSTSNTEDSFGIFDAPNETGSPERRLLLAVLERAILDYVGNDQKEITEAEEWIFGELTSSTFEEFSFSWVCQELDLDMHRIAKSIYDMPKRGSKRIAPWYFNNEKNSSKKPESNVKKSTVDASKVIAVNFKRVH